MKEFFSLPKQIQMRQAILFLSKMIGSAVLPFMSMYYVTYFGAFWTGILIIVTQVAGLVASLYGGHLADVWGRKPIILQGQIAAALGWLVTIVANISERSLPLLTFLGVFTVIVASNYCSPAFDAMVIDMTDETNRRFVYTIGYWFANIAVMLGAGIAGLFYDNFFLELLVALFIVNILCVIWVRNFHETKPHNPDFLHGHGLGDSFKNYGEVLLDVPFLTYTIGVVLYGAVWAQVDNYFAVHLKLSFETITLFGQAITGAKMLSAAVFINTAVIILLMTRVNSWTKSMRLAPQLILGGGLFALGLLLAFSVNTFWPLVVMILIYTAGEMIYVPASQVLRADMMDEGKIGSYSGLLSLAGPVGHILAGTMVSLSHFAGVFGVQIMLATVAIGGIFLMLKAARVKQLQI